MRLVSRVVQGAAAGVLATAAMSGVMLAARRAGLMRKMPPERITEKLLDALGLGRSEREENAAATAAHFGFGAAAGAPFALVRPPVVRRHPVLSGLLYGTLVWAASYGGWIPALGILPPPERDRKRRQAAMVAAHLVYGGVLGALAHRRRLR
jgi:hypothetical protein